MTLRLVYADKAASAAWRENIRATQEAIRRACSRGYREAAKLIEVRGRTNIAAAGNFGARWQNGLTVVSLPAQKFSINNRIIIGHDQIGARNFEFGGTVKGKPLLWIPLSFSDAKGKRAREYPGGLFRVERPGKNPLLLAIRDKKPKYVGLKQVRIPKKWRLRQIAERTIAKDLPRLYSDNLKVT